jgi:hypothetical protein
MMGWGTSPRGAPLSASNGSAPHSRTKKREAPQKREPQELAASARSATSTAEICTWCSMRLG